jgi:hypothetical protein
VELGAANPRPVTDLEDRFHGLVSKNPKDWNTATGRDDLTGLLLGDSPGSSSKNNAQIGRTGSGRAICILGTHQPADLDFSGHAAALLKDL